MLELLNLVLMLRLDYDWIKFWFKLVVKKCNIFCSTPMALEVASKTLK